MRPRSAGGVVALGMALPLLLGSPTLSQDTPDEGASAQDRRPKLAVRAQPNVGSTPARIILTAELLGGADDFEEYYCPTVIWEWGDDTVSESTVDCDPYQPGTSQIRRRYTVEHIFRRAGRYRVYFRLKQRSRIVASASVPLQITAGAGDYR
jgi:hypothetical protein